MTGAQFAPDNPPPNPWQALTAKDKADRVRVLVEQEGLSYGQAAARLGTSREAIAGVIERSRRRGDGIVVNPHRALVHHQAAARQNRPQVPKAKPKPPRPVNDAPLPPRDDAPLRSDAWAPLAGTTPIDLMALNQHTCRWPVTERPTLFCGLGTAPNSVYCDHHAAVGLRPPQPILKLPKGARS